MTTAFLVLCLFLLAVWALIFLLRPDLRRRMLLISAIAAPLGPLSEYWFLADYWQRATLLGPSIGPEDALFAFALGGIGFALHKSLFRLAIAESDHPRRHWIAALFPIAVLAALLLTDRLGINSILSSAMGSPEWSSARPVARRFTELRYLSSRNPFKDPWNTGMDGRFLAGAWTLR